MELKDCNPYIRAAEIQGAILEGSGPRKAYDHRLFYVLQHEGVVIIEGKTHALCAHTLILLPPEVEYYFIGNLPVMVVNFDITRACCHRSEPICPPPVEEFDPCLLFDRAKLHLLTAPHILQGNPYIQGCIARIIEEFNTGKNHADAITSGLLKTLLAELLENSFDTESSLCRRISAYIRVHASMITGNEQIAEAFGYHAVYLGELYHSVTGKTLHQSVMEERIALACRWLERTDSSIAEIAEACGFCSRTHFCTVFKKHVGVTPSVFRRSFLRQ